MLKSGNAAVHSTSEFQWKGKRREYITRYNERVGFEMYTTKERTAVYIMLSIMILSLLPVMYLGRYNHPVGDDYYYGAETVHIWEETGSLINTFAEAVKGVVYQYEHWQGTYSAMFLMHLPPNIFGDAAYRFVTAGILVLLSGGIFYLLKQIICGLLKGLKELWLISASLLTLLCVQTVPSQGETFFWYNGSMYYTGYYAITLFMFGIMFRYLTVPKKYHIPILAVLAVFLAGGNYVSLLPAILISAVITAFLILKKSKRAWGIGCTTALMIAGLLISAAAPGNAVRQSGMWKISAPVAVIKSLLQGLNFLRAWIGIWWILAAILLTPFLWKAFSKITFRFRYPVIFVGLAYGIFCSMSCPTFYTMNSTGPARAVAIVYYGFMLFTFISYAYLLGYLYRWLERRQVFESTERKPTQEQPGTCLLGKWVKKYDFCSFLRKWKPWLKGVVAAAVLCLAVMQLASGAAAQVTTGKAIRLLVSGEAAKYEQEYQERMAVLKDPTITDVVFLPYETQPDMLHVGDMTGDAEDVTNQKTARYFDKNSIRVQY